MTNNTTQRVTIAVTYTPETDIMDAAQSTHDWAEAVAKDARMSPVVTSVEVTEVQITPDRPVAFTFEESARIIEFMRKFEASSEANALLQMIATRNMYATVADLDLEEFEDDEPRGPKFGDVKSQTVLSVNLNDEDTK